MSGAGTVDNQGTITADSGFVATAAGIALANEGTITATNAGVLGFGGNGVVLTNGGNIAGAAFGVQATGAGSSIVNTGTIAGSAASAVGVDMAGGTLTNQAGGVISAGQSNGVYGTAIRLEGSNNAVSIMAGSTVNGSIDASATTDGSGIYEVDGSRARTRSSSTGMRSACQGRSASNSAAMLRSTIGGSTVLLAANIHAIARARASASTDRSAGCCSATCSTIAADSNSASLPSSYVGIWRTPST